MNADDIVTALSPATRTHPDLDLLVLHGSRARGDAHPRSDVDLAYLAAEPIDVLGLLADVSNALRTDDIDLVNLDTASALLRFRAARDGRVVCERRAGMYEAFVLEAALFWCDAESVISAAYRSVLADLG